MGEAAGVAASAGITEGHDVPTDVLTGVLFGCGRGGMIQSTDSTASVQKRLSGISIAATTGARLWAISRISGFARNAREPGTAATRVRKRTGMRVGTRRRVAQSKVS